MTKKDYVLIAGAIKRARAYAISHNEQDADVGITIAHTLAYELANTNPLFDRTRFLAACGVQS